MSSRISNRGYIELLFVQKQIVDDSCFDNLESNLSIGLWESDINNTDTILDIFGESHGGQGL